jgi:DNA (cytosine-5)-methyltransferase 1
VQSRNETSGRQEGSEHHSGTTLHDLVFDGSLLPTPNTMEHLPAREGEARERQLRRGKDESRRTASGNLREDILDLLPTVTVQDGKNTAGASQYERNTPPLNAEVTLLPTTRTSMKNGATAKEVAAGNPKARLEAVTNWGKFEPAIRRWEAVIGRAAPAPTKPDGKDGAHRLSSEFTEWMMGLPAGWITDCGLTRNEELKACGNGVVPQQAALALRMLLGRIETAGRTNQPG